MTNLNVIKVLTLQENQNFESTLFNLKKGWTIRFTLGSTLYGQKISLFINYPLDDKNFKRTEYREVEWQVESNSDASMVLADICLQLAGTFRYYFVRTADSDKEDVLGSGYLIVEPSLSIGNDVKLSLSSIQCQTVLSKCLGPLETWKDRLKVAHISGYNMIHFTPIQELGASQSAYSLMNQLKLNPMFKSQVSPGTEYGFADVEQLVEFMRKEWNMLSITDIVLNHTANETP